MQLQIENNQLLPQARSIERLEVEKKQNHFFETIIGTAINEAINYGIKKLLPNFLENQVIEIKDTLLQCGLKKGIQVAVEKLTDIGKSAFGMLTGNFKNISQIEMAIQKGGILDHTSKLLDKSLKKAKTEELIDTQTVELLNEGKTVITKSLEKNIKQVFLEQQKLLNKIENYEKDWKKAYEDKDFPKMDEAYKEMRKAVVETIPIEETIQKVSEIENIHYYIKNNGGNFEISQEEIQLAKRLK